jgi:hypothetical protein
MRVFTLAENDDSRPIRATHAQHEEAILFVGMFVIEIPQSGYVIKNLLSLLEPYSVLLTVRPILLFVPFELNHLRLLS